MKIALVDNGSKYVEELKQLVGADEVTVFPLENSADILEGAFDFIVLSGSSRFPIMENLDVLEPELRLIRDTSLPLLGICFGHELTNIAFGGTLQHTGMKKGIFPVRMEKDIAGYETGASFDVYQAHRWDIDNVAPDIHVLASSDHGPEIIRHVSRPILGFQFHPEVMPDRTHGHELYHSFVRTILPTLPSLPSSTAADS